MSNNNAKPKWYVTGLHFECSACGSCCCGPDEGYVWATRKEIELIAEFLQISVEQLRGKYTRKIDLRTSLLEKPTNKDCVFLTETSGKRGCSIYPVRPSQCRAWPFWPGNLRSPDDWNTAAMKCPGINRGKLYTLEEIEKLKNQKDWWTDAGGK